MIRFATEHDKPAVQTLTQQTFAHNDKFWQRFFNNRYRADHCLVAEENNTIVATLQLIPYQIIVDEKSYSAVYLYAICTAPEQRKRGFMRRLVEFALAELKKQGIAVVFLSPQEEYLVAVYEKFGFWRAFVSKLEKLLPLLLSAPDAEEAYRYYAEFYHNKNHIKLSRTQFDFLYRELRYHHSNPPEKALALILNNEKLSWITIENTQLGLIDD